MKNRVIVGSSLKTWTVLPGFTLPVLSLVLIFIGLGLFWWDGTHFAYVSRDFSYSATLNISDYTYNAATQQFEDNRHFTAKFYHQIEPGQDIASSGGMVAIKSAIDAQSRITKSTVTLNRVHAVEMSTGKYVATTQNGISPNEYLFAPRGLQPKQSFTTRQIPYDAPAPMQYLATEKVRGLEVFHYRAAYPQKGVERTGMNALNLPATQGVRYVPMLEMWIEPVSGWLVNLQTTTTVEIFDRTTGDTVRPYSRYSGEYTTQTIEQQASYAHSVKSRLIFETQIVPRIVFASPFVLFACGLTIYKSEQLVNAYQRIRAKVVRHRR
jgi:hypothetical protein